MRKLEQLIKSVLETKVLLKLSKGNRFIFVYHDISDVNSVQHSRHYSTPIDLFKQHLALLHECFSIISLDELVTNKHLANTKNYAAICFDDGFYSVYQNAKPLLDTLKLPYTVFANAAAIINNQLWLSNLEILKHDKHYSAKLLQVSETSLAADEDVIGAIVKRGVFNRHFREGYTSEKIESKIYLNEFELRQLANEGVEIGNHSYDHFVLGALEPGDLKQQIHENHELLEKICNKNIKHFALPFGKREHYTATTVRELRAAKYAYIYTTNPNKFRSKDLNDKNFLFPRIGITHETPKQVLVYINRSILKQYHL